jgi:hypothetical protein
MTSFYLRTQNGCNDSLAHKNENRHRNTEIINVVNLTMNLDNLNSFKPVGETTLASSNHVCTQNSPHVYGDESLSDDYNNFMAEGNHPNTFRTHSESENEMSSLSTPPESDGDQSSSRSSSDLSDDEEFDLTFLMQKRNILKRYCDVLKASEFYDASIAKNPLPEVPNPIWNEAKEMMKELFEVSDGPIALAPPPTMPLVRVSKRPRIDISNVSRIDSKAYTSATENIHATLGSINDKHDKLPIVCDSKWMVMLLQDLSTAEKHSGIGRALSSDATSRSGVILTRECGEIKLDPLVGIALCASEANKEMCRSIAMEDALMITDTVQ